MFHSSGPDNKGRDGQVMSPAVRLESAADQELVSVWHRGYPLPDGFLGAAPSSGDDPCTLSPHDDESVVNSSGVLVSPFLPFKVKITENDTPKFSSSACSMNDPVTTMSPPSADYHVIFLLDKRPGMPCVTCHRAINSWHGGKCHGPACHDTFFF